MTRKMHPFHRTELAIGGAAFDRLGACRVAVIGLGGVGSYAAEALVRSGVGHVTLVDFDRVCVTNVNRQLHALRRTVGEPKSALMADRARQINPRAEIVELQRFYEAATSDGILGVGFDYVLDCIDNMKAKIHLLGSCLGRGIPVIASMGAGGRLDPTRVRVTDISLTHTDPFARIVRDLLRREGIHEGITAVWSEEPPVTLDAEAEAAFRCICAGKDENEKHTCEQRFQVQGSVSWMPALFGLTMAGAVVNHLIGRDLHQERRKAPRAEAPSRTA